MATNDIRTRLACQGIIHARTKRRAAGRLEQDSDLSGFLGGCLAGSFSQLLSLGQILQPVLVIQVHLRPLNSQDGVPDQPPCLQDHEETVRPEALSCLAGVLCLYSRPSDPSTVVLLLCIWGHLSQQPASRYGLQPCAPCGVGHCQLQAVIFRLRAFKRASTSDAGKLQEQHASMR